jgi:hypothetical protein
MNIKPASLNDVEERFRVVVEQACEPVSSWLQEFYGDEVTPTVRRRFRGLLEGKPYSRSQGSPKLQSRELIKIDDLCAGHFLTPPERTYVERLRRQAERKTP